jgi:hypothetical protein
MTLRQAQGHGERFDKLTAPSQVEGQGRTMKGEVNRKD